MRSIPYIIKRTIFLIKERGVVNSYKFMYSRYGYFLKYGIKLSKVFTPDELNLPNMYAYKYEPIMHYSFNRMLKGIDWDWKESTFIDIGCGKGAAILLATRYNFKRYIGVELSPLLAEECRKNIRKFIGKKEIDYAVYNCDATKYAIPDDVNVFYFFNPFAPPVLKVVLYNIELSLIRNPRKILILYFNAMYLPIVLDSGYKIIYAEKTDPVARYKYGSFALTN
ncbi:class I SAM-dependent methyltransferase [Elizabethkingia bruuniana]|uniref:Class I SAM-dependent methyltransferase n=1 Tax=Elizabethkingia bruuniana TaxID=1756149 RepID=A0A7T7V267_9FLAO|nr:class I SAM-dependent methyltransferase [Elizabethkingia bruuniana]KGO08404.1 hypothetical protein KS04_21500 [Elizabethkingia miricola]AQX86797.1 hypothetical protein AYC65_18090 [Elizabethkingia bruuniana]KUY26966.1 hypothetical protein ATB97_05560 [Elizabethkingia bruuniana]OPB66600.1 hypothetical protein BAY12_03650 [Elizabethkingia bruuniana]QDZ64022.1 class I SAM-dependent methyltransferase [Elizabethkingia bruuniana]